MTFLGPQSRQDRVPGFLSSRPNWLPPPPHPQASVAPAFGSRGGGTHSLPGDGGGEPIPTKGQPLSVSNTLVLYNPTN
jgi:hypothetical protein